MLSRYSSLLLRTKFAPLTKLTVSSFFHKATCELVKPYNVGVLNILQENVGTGFAVAPACDVTRIQIEVNFSFILRCLIF